jgi:hypothetical protein
MSTYVTSNNKYIIITLSHYKRSYTSINRKSFECKEYIADYYENEQGRLEENISREERYNECSRHRVDAKSFALVIDFISPDWI